MKGYRFWCPETKWVIFHGEDVLSNKFEMIKTGEGLDAFGGLREN